MGQRETAIWQYFQRRTPQKLPPLAKGGVNLTKGVDTIIVWCGILNHKQRSEETFVSTDFLLNHDEA